MSHQFQLSLISWAGNYFPDPSAWDSSMADTPNSQNICGVKISEIDRVSQIFKRMFFQHQRVEALKKVDKILMENSPYVLGWGKDYERILFWNKFSFPEGYISKTGDFWDILFLWWLNPEKEMTVKESAKNKEIKMDIGKIEDRYWLERK